LTRLLGAVLGAGLLAVGNAGGVESRADHLVAVARQVLDAAAAHEHDRVLLQVVALTGDVGADLDPVRQPHARDLPQRRIRLLGRHRGHAGADPPLLRGALERGRLRLLALGLAALANQLVDSRHESLGGWKTVVYRRMAGK